MYYIKWNLEPLDILYILADMPLSIVRLWRREQKEWVALSSRNLIEYWDPVPLALLPK